MTVGTTLQSATSARYRKSLNMLSVVAGVVLCGCSLESTLETLVNQFPKHRTELQQVAGLMATLHSEIGMTGYSQDHSRYCKSPPCVSIGNEDYDISVDMAQKRFPRNSDQLAEIRKLATRLKLDYFSMYQEEYIRIIMDGGGTLGGDNGYLFSMKGGAPSRAAQYFKAIPDEEKWYAFVD